MSPFKSAGGRGIFIMGDSLCALPTFATPWITALHTHRLIDAGIVCFGGVSTEQGPVLIPNAPSDATIVISLGTNDLYARQIEQFRGWVEATLDLARSRNVLWVLPGVNHRSPLYEFEGAAITVLRSERGRYPNLRLLDWDGEYNRHPADQTADGVHATERGFGIRAAYIAEALDRAFPEPTHR